MSIHRLPGLIDPHVHLREPGGTHKEDYATGTAAALAGGITTVLDMPNTYPPTTDAGLLAEKRALAAANARCDVGLYLGASRDNATQGAAAAAAAAGLKIYVNETYGPLRIDNLATLMAHFQAWPKSKPIAVHAEGLTVAQVIGLGLLYGQRVHFCHVSRKAEIELIAHAKQKGARITCEVTPHHLFLTEADADRLGPFGQMRPPLATLYDQIALWAHLDFVDCIATDHAPHTVDEKRGAQPPPGVPGLETMLPLMLTAVAEKRLSLERLIELTVTNPARIFGLPVQPETWVEVEIGTTWEIPEKGLFTKCGWTPFAGMPVQGRVLRTYLRGALAYAEGSILAKPGQGRVLFA